MCCFLSDTRTLYSCNPPNIFQIQELFYLVWLLKTHFSLIFSLKNINLNVWLAGSCSQGVVYNKESFLLSVASIGLIQLLHGQTGRRHKQRITLDIRLRTYVQTLILNEIIKFVNLIKLIFVFILKPVTLLTA
jgi:hypothetical protein